MSSFNRDDERQFADEAGRPAKPSQGHWEAPPSPQSDFALGMSVCDAMDRTCEWLHARQAEAGYWCGELEGDSILESEYVLLLAWLEQAGSAEAQKAARYLLKKQAESGGWSQYPGGPIDVSASVKAYFALKLTGHDPQAEYMQRARSAIRDAGGADAVNSFTRYYLALLGQIDFELCPAVPPEAMLLPRWFPINIYRISAWSRTIFVPLAIVWALRPVRPVDEASGVQELFVNPPEQWGRLRCPGEDASRGREWRWFFHATDRALRWMERWRVRPLRSLALRRAEAWMLRRFGYSDGLGAIFPPIIWSVIALACRGYDAKSAERTYCMEQLAALIREEDDTVRLEPCKSPVWDTALTLRALQGVDAESPAIDRGVRWLLEKEITRAGDWSATVKAEPGGWCFQHNNEFYPDVDDTIMVMMALRGQIPHAEPLVQGDVMISSRRAKSMGTARREVATVEQIIAACSRGRKWVLAMQNRDGGWGAFDRNNDREFLCHVPFADHNAMIDPSTPDITARVLECLAQWGMQQGCPAVDRAIAYLRETQEDDGTWYGRWGVNYIYGVWQCLVGLRAAGIPASDPAIEAGAAWLKRTQQPCGGWGESAETYAEPHLRGQGPTTPSQTAWAVLGLLAACGPSEPAVIRGVRYLLDQQREDGGWDETEFTGTGFPLVFYLRYHMYPIYFPLLALAQWSQEAELNLLEGKR